MMKRFARLFVVTLGLAILGLVVTLVPHKDAHAQAPAQVQVVNTPLPVTVRGIAQGAPLQVTGGVTVANTPLPVTVRGIAQGAPLQVTGGVTVANTPLPVTGNVVLSGNTAATPLFVSNVDEPGRIPYQSEALLNSCLAISCSYTFNNPSVGHRLVVQHISGSWTNTTSGATLIVVASADTGAPRSLFDKTEPGSTIQFFFDQPVLFYVDSGRSFSVNLSVNSGTSLGASISVSGYLVDCGASPCAPIAESTGTS